MSSRAGSGTEAPPPTIFCAFLYLQDHMNNYIRILCEEWGGIQTLTDLTFHI